MLFAIPACGAHVCYLTPARQQKQMHKVDYPQQHIKHVNFQSWLWDNIK